MSRPPRGSPALVSLVLFPARHGGDREPPPGGRGAHQGRAHRARRTLEQARRTLRAHRRAGHRPHGDGGLRRCLLGRACHCRRRAAGASARWRAPPYPGLQFLRAGADAEGGAGRRSRAAARTRLPCGEAPARLSDARRRSCGRARRQVAHPGGRRADGRLQPGRSMSTRRSSVAARSTARTSPGSRSRSGTTTMPARR